jgi:hypothetical protein
MERDLLQVLADDHALLGWVAGRLQCAPSPRGRRAVFPELAAALAAHQTVVDRTVLPALKEMGWHGIRSDLLASHVALKRQLAETVALEREGGDADRALRALALEVQAQCGREILTLLPVLAQRLDGSQRSMLGLDAQQHLTRLLGDTPKTHADVEQESGVADLLDEAYVVLSSLPTRQTTPQPRR